MIDAVLEQIDACDYRGLRRLVAIVGPPASGKSTLADQLAARGENILVVPMDGFHLDNSLLSPRGLLDRKGAPDTIDVAGLHYLLRRLQAENDVIFPKFDRALDRSIAGAGHVGPHVETVVVEGNYLLLDQPQWRDLAGFWDFSVRLDVPDDILQERLVARWLAHGFDREDALRKTLSNDMKNAGLMRAHALPADITIKENEMRGELK